MDKNTQNTQNTQNSKIEECFIQNFILKLNSITIPSEKEKEVYANIVLAKKLLNSQVKDHTDISLVVYHRFDAQNRCTPKKTNCKKSIEISSYHTNCIPYTDDTFAEA